MRAPRGGSGIGSLSGYSAHGFSRGRSRAVEAAWLIVQAVLVSSWLPGSWHRRVSLRAFGARIGSGVVIKPGLSVKFPWRLTIGDDTWLGERVWIDNLAQVSIGSSCCISQGAYLCTGSHDWSKPGFDLITRPIRIADHAWIAAAAVVAPGVVVGEGAVLTLGSVAAGDLAEWMIHRGNPATAIRRREPATEAEI
jgi:putative colanic acid biosynthesis acetyltransferase WcaF